MMLLIHGSAGLLFWAFGFSLLYGLHGLGCGLGWPLVELAGGSLFRWTMIGTWLLLCAGGVLLIGLARRAPAGLGRRLALVSALVGLGATLVTGAPVVVASACI